MYILQHKCVWGPCCQNSKCTFLLKIFFFAGGGVKPWMTLSTSVFIKPLVSNMNLKSCVVYKLSYYSTDSTVRDQGVVCNGWQGRAAVRCKKTVWKLDVGVCLSVWQETGLGVFLPHASSTSRLICRTKAGTIPRMGGSKEWGGGGCQAFWLTKQGEQSGSCCHPRTTLLFFCSHSYAFHTL